MRLVVNEQERDAEPDPRTSLLELLRDQFNLKGTKLGCNQGGCGACTVLLDGRRVLACLTLAVQCAGRRVVTIEGVGKLSKLHPLQHAFVEHDGLQCGYCTPGQICSAIGMAHELANGMPSRTSMAAGIAVPMFSEAEIRERMSGNLCRCGAYNGIVAAILSSIGEVSAP